MNEPPKVERRSLSDLPPERWTDTDLSSAELLKRMIADSQELIRLELELAKDDLGRQMKQGKASALTALSAALLFVLGTSLLLVGAAIALSIPLWALGSVFVLVASGFAFVAYRLLPKAPMADTRNRVESDIHELKAHIV